jgi:hypothetical protein
MAAAFPSSLAWVERGSVLIRRMNSERIAEDPRLRRLLFPSAAQVEEEATEIEDKRSGPPATAAALSDAEAQADETPPKDALQLSPGSSFEQIEAATDAELNKQESDNAAPNTYRVLLWTYRVHASLQNALQYAVFAKASEDGYFVPIAPRYVWVVGCLVWFGCWE